MSKTVKDILSKFYDQYYYSNDEKEKGIKKVITQIKERIPKKKLHCHGYTDGIVDNCIICIKNQTIHNIYIYLFGEGV